MTRKLSYRDVENKARALGWDDEAVSTLQERFDNAYLHGHSDTARLDNKVYDYDWVVLSDPDWYGEPVPYIVAYRYAQRDKYDVFYTVKQEDTNHV